MLDEDIKKLLQAILDYSAWLSTAENSKRRREHYTHVLIEFLIFTVHREIPWKDVFLLDTLRGFQKNSNGLQGAGSALMSLSRYLYEKGRIPEPLTIPNHQIPLPDIYEQYLLYLQEEKAACDGNIKTSRRVLASLHGYLEHHGIALGAIKIEYLDAFLAKLNKPLSTTTRRDYRRKIREFLKYLYDRKVLERELAHLVVGPPVFNQLKPPRFLRDDEIKKLFNSIPLDTNAHIRTYTMLMLAYSLGLRPGEIRQITLDDISFQKAELTIPIRKNKHPAVMPLPEKTLKAIVLYVQKVRPKTHYRELFLTLVKPYRPICTAIVPDCISKTMKAAGLSASAYSLRHSYAQRLLCMGHSIFDIKEMMGHKCIQSTQHYLHIDTEMMRKVLLNETL
jgi:integrase/recombinase XerD